MGYWLGGEKIRRKSWVHKVVAEIWEKVGCINLLQKIGKNQVHKVVAENWKKIRCRNMGQWYAIEQLMEHAIIYYTAPGD